MSTWSSKFASKWTTEHENGVIVHGSTEPILTALELGGFPIKNMYLVGTNPDCGRIVVPTKDRADAARAALEPGYAVQVTQQFGDWAVEFTRRALDGSEPSRFITDVELKDGTGAMRNGYPTR